MAYTEPLVEFLLARFHEVELTARAVPTAHGTVPPAHWSTSDSRPDQGRVVMGTADDFVLPTPAHAEHVARHDPARVIADVVVKRWIVQQYVRICDSRQRSEVTDEASRGMLMQLYVVLGGLAMLFADHPDYNPRWAQGSLLVFQREQSAT
jgi:hypothetical protein